VAPSDVVAEGHRGVGVAELVASGVEAVLAGCQSADASAKAVR
jgi:hypothetical protein